MSAKSELRPLPIQFLTIRLLKKKRRNYQNDLFLNCNHDGTCVLVYLCEKGRGILRVKACLLLVLTWLWNEPDTSIFRRIGSPIKTCGCRMKSSYWIVKKVKMFVRFHHERMRNRFFSSRGHFFLWVTETRSSYLFCRCSLPQLWAKHSCTEN